MATDIRNLVTTYSIDGLGNLTQTTSPDTGSTAKTYDAAGNVASVTDAKGPPRQNSCRLH
ncbi:MAG TPA: RHS repeat domain-containing protein [Noviherbaspirillum sp.]|nr:RHS repeat domain-containing protein [Noviherbaspirillum sp.]